MAESVEDGRSY